MPGGLSLNSHLKAYYMYFWAALVLWLCPDVCTSKFLATWTKAVEFLCGVSPM